MTFIHNAIYADPLTSSYIYRFTIIAPGVTFAATLNIKVWQQISWGFTRILQMFISS